MSLQRRLMSVDIESIRRLPLSAVARHARGGGFPCASTSADQESTTTRGFDLPPMAGVSENLRTAWQRCERRRKEKNVWTSARMQDVWTACWCCGLSTDQPTSPKRILK